jgi:hypothetical protein
MPAMWRNPDFQRVEVETDKTEPYADFLKRFYAAHPGTPPLASGEPGEIAELIAATASQESRKTWLSELMAATPQAPARPSLGVMALLLAGVVIAATMAYGIFIRPEFLISIADVGHARGLITFLFAFGTIAVILIISIATFWAKIDEVERRVTIAKDTLTILIGIFGTILGFYFGSQQPPSPPSEPPAATQPQ